jgi:plasmid stabilization system protein ParE
MMGFRFLDDAILELEDAAGYYEQKSKRLSLELRDEVERALGYLCEFPHAAKRLDKIHRSYKLHRFPYLLIYRIEEGELVVAAVAHAAREQGYWRGRLDDLRS